ncbi:MAG: penicillin-binding protein 2 [Bacteroidetes bacterium]|uniref:Penicillin-binding protein 2 n=1 Tax=Candidatus Cryptobacteroides faecipullorum TaxID=2840764 RepID=A0A9D9I6T3_9BACT|nr:penicillin-binding protein 2 [Candidatus Cryptobacteroides faecipullorum]
MTLNRKNKILAGLTVAALILIGRLFVIQILDDSYKIDASNNSMVYSTIYPTRGIIYDRNGKILVGNRVAYDILVTPKEVTEFDTLALGEALGVPADFIRGKMAEYHKNRRRIGYQSVVMLKQLPPETYMRFAELSFKFPGFRGQPRSIRQYPYNAGGNLLGYVSEVDSRYIESHHGEYKAGDYAGMTGIEATCEKYLKGEKGYKIYLRDSRNRIESSYRDGEMDKEAIPGKDIVTTIDAELQHYGQTLMQNKVGSLVAIEPSTGEILALISSPGIDVDVLADIGSHYNRILSDPLKPMFNRAVQASYPPGSVFKLVNALIGLQEGVVTPQTEYPCHRGYRYGNRKMGCHDHRSPLDMKESIMMSCNAYYCYVLRSILENPEYGSVSQALAKWDEYVSGFGFGRKLGSDFPSELGGDIPDPELYDRMYGKGRWKATNIISLSIGQGEIGCTPLHLANLCAIMANRGFYYIPHIIKSSEGVEIDPKYTRRNYTMVDTSYFPAVVEGMYMAVNAGFGSGATASIAAVEGLDICGKTGTAQNPHGDDNSVFICFAPKDNPKIAVAAYIEHGSFGARWAAPIASLLTEKYLTRNIDDSRKELEKRMIEGVLLDKYNDR